LSSSEITSPALRPTQPSTQLLTGALSSEAKGPRGGAEKSTACSVKN